MVQIWAARTSGIRGALAMHCWLVLKPQGPTPFERWDVVGRRARTGRIGLQRNARSPREGWGGHRAWRVLDLRGAGAAAAAARDRGLDRPPTRTGSGTGLGPAPTATASSPTSPARCRRWRTALPPLAIGKDWLPGWTPARRGAERHRRQLSLLGLAGILVAAEEGIEIGWAAWSSACRRRSPGLLLPGLGTCRCASPYGALTGRSAQRASLGSVRAPRRSMCPAWPRPASPTCHQRDARPSCSPIRSWTGCAPSARPWRASTGSRSPRTAAPTFEALACGRCRLAAVAMALPGLSGLEALRRLAALALQRRPL